MTKSEETIAVDRVVKWRDLINRKYLSDLLILALAIWLHAANSMLTTTIMPAAVDEIGGVSLISWAFSLYLVGSVAAACSVSLIVASFGMRRTMFWAAVVYGAGCAICAGAPNMPVMLSGRLVQGMGGGSLVAMVFVIQDRLFPNRFAPRIVAFLSMVWTTSAFCGPIIGGAFATYSSWRLAFAAFVIQAALLCVAVLYKIRPEQAASKLDLDDFPIVRILTIAGAVFSFSMAGYLHDPLYSALFIVTGVGLIVLFVFRDRSAGNSRLMPERAFSLDQITGSGILMTLVFSLSMMSFLVYGPFLLIEIYQLNAFQAGLVVLMESVGWGAGAILFSGVAPEREPVLLRVGGLFAFAGLALLTWFVPFGPLWAVVATAFLANAGFGTIWGYIIKNVVGQAGTPDKDRASSIVPSTQQTGFAIGASLSGLLANSLGIELSVSVEGMQFVAFWLFAAFVPPLVVGYLLLWRFASAIRRLLTP
ncbi:MAG: MFS transporter [Pseudomonadota bacterium]